MIVSLGPWQMEKLHGVQRVVQQRRQITQGLISETACDPERWIVS